MKIHRPSVLGVIICFLCSVCHGGYEPTSDLFSYVNMSEGTASDLSNSESKEEEAETPPPIEPEPAISSKDATTTAFITGAFVIISTLLFFAGYAATKTGEGSHPTASDMKAS